MIRSPRALPARGLFCGRGTGPGKLHSGMGYGILFSKNTLAACGRSFGECSWKN